MLQIVGAREYSPLVVAKALCQVGTAVAVEQVFRLVLVEQKVLVVQKVAPEDQVQQLLLDQVEVVEIMMEKQWPVAVELAGQSEKEQIMVELVMVEKVRVQVEGQQDLMEQQ